MIRPLRVVAIDLGIANIGIAATHDQVGEPRLACRTITPRPRDRRPTVMDHERIHETVAAIMATVACRPDLVVIELPILVDGKGDTSVRLGEIHGPVKHWLWSQGIRYVDVHLTHVKQYATGNGQSKKPAVLEAVIARYGRLLHVGSYDEADAVSMLMQAVDQYGSRVMNPKGEWVSPPQPPPSHRKALAASNWPALTIGAE